MGWFDNVVPAAGQVAQQMLAAQPGGLTPLSQLAQPQQGSGAPTYGQINQLYQQHLGRSASQDEAQNWLNGTYGATDLAGIGSQIAGSGEAQAYAANPTIGTGNGMPFTGQNVMSQGTGFGLPPSVGTGNGMPFTGQNVMSQGTGLPPSVGYQAPAPPPFLAPGRTYYPGGSATFNERPGQYQTPGTGAAGGAAQALMQAPDGTTQVVPADQVAHYLARGARRVR